MCMMKEVEPFACTRNWVFRVSRTKAMTRKLPNAHHPETVGGCCKCGKRQSGRCDAGNDKVGYDVRDVIVMNKGLGIQVIAKALGPVLAFTLAEQTSKEVGNRCEQVCFQHERQPPSREKA